VLETLLIKLVNKNKIDWDEHLLIVFFSYIITYKIGKRYTSYHLVYGLHPLMLTKYILLVINSDHRKGNRVRFLTNRVLKLKKLQ
jgi:hypothetical protein